MQQKLFLGLSSYELLSLLVVALVAWLFISPLVAAIRDGIRTHKTTPARRKQRAFAARSFSIRAGTRNKAAKPPELGKLHIEGGRRHTRRSRLAWTFRAIADRLDGAKSLSLAVTDTLDHDDLWDAVRDSQPDIAAKLAVLAEYRNGDTIGKILCMAPEQRTADERRLVALMAENPHALARIEYRAEEIRDET